jgi:hypothetical protein
MHSSVSFIRVILFELENFLAGLMISVHHYAHMLVELVAVLRLLEILS